MTKSRTKNKRAEGFDVSDEEIEGLIESASTGGEEDEYENKPPGYCIDYKLNRMGTWATTKVIDQHTGEVDDFVTDLVLPSSLFTEGKDSADLQATKLAVGNFYIRVTTLYRGYTASGEPNGTHVDLEMKRGTGGNEETFTARNVPIKTLSDVEFTLELLENAGFPLMTSQAAGRALRKVVLAVSEWAGYDIVSEHERLGWHETKRDGIMYLTPEGALTPKIVEGESIDTSNVGRIGVDKAMKTMSITKSESFDQTAESFVSVCETLTKNGMEVFGASLGFQTATICGAPPPGVLAGTGRASLGKTMLFMNSMMNGRRNSEIGPITPISTNSAIEGSYKGLNHVPTVVDDFNTSNESKQQEKLVEETLRVGYAGDSAGRQRAMWGEKGISTSESDSPSHTLIITTSEDTLEAYSSAMRSSSLSRFIEVPFTEHPTTDVAEVLKKEFRTGYLEHISYEILRQVFRDFTEGFPGEKLTLRNLQVHIEEGVKFNLRDKNDIEFFNPRVERFLGVFRFGAERFVNALEGHPEAQKWARAIFVAAEKNIVIPEVDNRSKIASTNSVSVTAEIQNLISGSMNSGIWIAASKSRSGDAKSYSAATGVDVERMTCVGTITEFREERYLALNTTLIFSALRQVLPDNVTSAKKLATFLQMIPGACKSQLKLGGLGRKQYHMIPLSSWPELDVGGDTRPPAKKTNRKSRTTGADDF